MQKSVKEIEMEEIPQVALVHTFIYAWQETRRRNVSPEVLCVPYEARRFERFNGPWGHLALII